MTSDKRKNWKKSERQKATLKKQRSHIMSKIKSTRTSPELKLKKTLNLLGFEYQPRIHGNPDFANRKTKTTIFVDGCFWHKCPRCFRFPKTNRKFWKEKIEKNAERDRKTNKELRKEGWKVIRIWEHDINGKK